MNAPTLRADGTYSIQDERGDLIVFSIRPGAEDPAKLAALLTASRELAVALESALRDRPCLTRDTVLEIYAALTKAGRPPEAPAFPQDGRLR